MDDFEFVWPNFEVWKAGANPGKVFGNALTVSRPQASNLGPGIADIQLAPYQTSHQNSPLIGRLCTLVIFVNLKKCYFIY